MNIAVDEIFRVCDATGQSSVVVTSDAIQIDIANLALPLLFASLICAFLIDMLILIALKSQQIFDHHRSISKQFIALQNYLEDTARERTAKAVMAVVHPTIMHGPETAAPVVQRAIV